MSGHRKWSEIRRGRIVRQIPEVAPALREAMKRAKEEVYIPKGRRMAENPAGAKTKKIEPPKSLAEAKEQEYALLGDYLDLEQQRDNHREQVDVLTRKMGDIRYMIYATREFRRKMIEQGRS